MRKIFDGHLHTFRFKVSVRESIDLFRRQFERFNIKKCTFLSLPCDPVYGRTGLEVTDSTDNIKSIYFKKIFSPDAYAYAGLEYKHLDLKDTKAVAEDLLRQVKEYKKVGFDGMKMYEGHPNMHQVLGYKLTDEVYDLYLDQCEKENFPRIMHLAHPPYMWEFDKVDEYWRNRGCYFGPEFPTFNDLHKEVIGMMEKHPKLNFTLAHWGFLTFNKEMAEKFMSFENTKLDICPGGDNFFEVLEDKEYWLPFIEKYQDRMFYGTDSYNFEYDNEENWLRATGARPEFVQRWLSEDNEYVYAGKTFNGVKLPKEIQDKIYFDNLYKMLGEPNQVDLDYFITKCDELLKTVDENSLDRYNLWCMKNDFETMKKKGVLEYYG